MMGINWKLPEIFSIWNKSLWGKNLNEISPLEDIIETFTIRLYEYY